MSNKYNKKFVPSETSLLGQFFKLTLIVCCLTWLIAVIKVFLLEDWKLNRELEAYLEANYEKLSEENQVLSPGLTSNSKIHLITSRELHKLDKRDFSTAVADSKKSYDFKYDPAIANSYAVTTNKPIIFNSNEFNDLTMEPTVALSNVVMVSSHRKPAYELSWPPMSLDGSVPSDEGYDIMPLTGLKVPRFWEAAPGSDINTIGTKIDGRETIFLMIASYRDFQCRETITSAFLRADYPERLFVGAVDQVVPGDIGCADVDVPCEIDPSQPLCKYRNQISLFKMDAQYATGPVTARHIGDRMYRGQYFVMQMDAHCHFVRHWDSKIIDQWKSTRNEMAVLSSYLTDFQGSLDENFDSTRSTRPIMCNSDFEGEMPARYLRHGSQPEEEPVIRDMPQLQPFWAAGFSFSRGHFKYRVPYDGYQPMVFQGEEIAIGIRGFTHGYDFYAPRDSVVFHEYADGSKRRKKIHMFWENSQKHIGEGKKSLRRATAVIGMAPDLDPSSWDHSEIEKYGLGKVRSLELFYKLFLIDPVARKAVQLCPFVRSGKMHENFQAHLRPDHLGIDYNDLVDYDTKSAMKGIFLG